MAGASYNTEQRRTRRLPKSTPRVVGKAAHEKAHRAALQAIFAPKFTHLVCPDSFSSSSGVLFHLGFY